MDRGDREALLGQETRAWLQELADRDHDGDWGAAAAAVLEDACTAAKDPNNPWVFLEAQQRRRIGSRRG
ncbi:hypothetical protein GCM10010168_85750 [Actinoplanes ianthinogenes]|uniref:Uncharacterized protein n=1 Tax=Actinoplanes ianthinogenes TaxID=122358 RepID=A0ABN6CJF8_9ACTN|nr:hypothetical protein Aiant_59630 [Actinoplanes ianthinogenes]GGR53682.1 hypothetical protein GCM10010168_85750 [Actinoplanes ianthinogenes]